MSAQKMLNSYAETASTPAGAPPNAPSAALREEVALLAEMWGTVEPFDENRHGELLRALWHAAFGDESPYERRSRRWESLGFQSDDPARDLRGTGAMGLAHLVDFCRSGAGAAAVRRCTRGESTFPLAAASLNVTHMLCAHLHALPTPCNGATTTTTAGTFAALNAPCSTEVLRNAVRLQMSSWLEPPARKQGARVGASPERAMLESAPAAAQPPSLLALMHAQLLRRVCEQWAAARLDDGRSAAGVGLLRAFPPMLAETASHMRSALARTPGPWSVHGVLLALRGDGGPARGLALEPYPSLAALPSCAGPRAWARLHPCPIALYRLAAAAAASLWLFGSPSHASPSA